MALGILRNVLLAILFISVITFIALFGQLPALRKTPIGWTHRLLCVHAPASLKRLDDSITGGRVTTRFQRLSHFLFFERNPIIMILFLFVLTGAIILFIYNAWPLLPVSLQLPIPLLIIQPFLWTYLCVTHKSHYITTLTHQNHMSQYPYDHILFRPSKVCQTCQQLKPARSKHCSLCGFCVAMCDHHCPWVNTCVGRGNYRYFLYLLLSIGMMEIYGVYLSYTILQPYLTFNPLHRATLIRQAWYERAIDMSITAINAGGISIAGVGMLAFFTFPLPLGLLVYHCYLIWAGMTTNESQKWADWRDDMADGSVFFANRGALRGHLEERRRAVGEDGEGTKGGSERAIAAMLGKMDEEPSMTWPVENEVILVATTDGRPPLGQEALWTHVWSLKDVVNVYDLGGWENFKAILLVGELPSG